MYQCVGVAGGSGFLGRSVVSRLAKSGYKIKVFCRNSENAKSLKIFGDPGQIEIISGNINNQEDLERFVKNCDIIINLVAIFFEYGFQSFTNIHILAPFNLAKTAKKHKISNFIQVSNIGADEKSISKTLRSRARGEKNIKKIYPNVTIVRPSLIFGNNDPFFFRFAKMSAISPFLPIVDGGKNLFQPVYVNDVSLAILKIIKHKTLQGKTYELGGPKTYSFKNLLDYLLLTIGKKRYLLSVNGNILKLPAMVMSYFPNPAITNDQIVTLKLDNVVNVGLNNFNDLGIIPVCLEKVMPSYLSVFKKKIV